MRLEVADGPHRGSHARSTDTSRISHSSEAPLTDESWGLAMTAAAGPLTGWPNVLRVRAVNRDEPDPAGAVHATTPVVVAYHVTPVPSQRWAACAGRIGLDPVQIAAAAVRDRRCHDLWHLVGMIRLDVRRERVEPPSNRLHQAQPLSGPRRSLDSSR